MTRLFHVWMGILHYIACSAWCGSESYPRVSLVCHTSVVVVVRSETTRGNNNSNNITFDVLVWMYGFSDWNESCPFFIVIPSVLSDWLNERRQRAWAVGKITRWNQKEKHISCKTNMQMGCQLGNHSVALSHRRTHSLCDFLFIFIFFCVFKRCENKRISWRERFRAIYCILSSCAAHITPPTQPTTKAAAKKKYQLRILTILQH